MWYLGSLLLRITGILYDELISPVSVPTPDYDTTAQINSAELPVPCLIRYQNYLISSGHSFSCLPVRTEYRYPLVSLIIANSLFDHLKNGRLLKTFWSLTPYRISVFQKLTFVYWLQCIAELTCRIQLIFLLISPLFANAKKTLKSLYKYQLPYVMKSVCNRYLFFYACFLSSVLLWYIYNLIFKWKSEWF
jgi:hypothetical protein